jgi:hypothetical protein
MYEADEEILYQRDEVAKFYLHADAIFFFYLPIPASKRKRKGPSLEKCHMICRKLLPGGTRM